MEINSGSVLIDGIDVSSIPINHVRRSLNTLSQEAFFLRGTIRENLITAHSAADSDERLQAVLTRAGLWNKVLSIGSLDSLLDSEEAFSHGERQLFCLARAMLNTSKILLLDEFTSKYASLPRLLFSDKTKISSVDIETDRAMQKIIREDFKDRTIIAVAHRLETILDFDHIVVLDGGVIVEQGAPSVLLQGSSAFKGLYNAYRKERSADGGAQ
jgi:ABC-type multidrug transport system fused ATPase/permease subunit